MADVEELVLGLDAPTLAEMLLDEANRSAPLRGRLLARATVQQADPEGRDIRWIRREIDEAARVRGYVPYEQAWDFAQGISDSVDLIEELVDGDAAAEAIELAEHALRKVESVIESVDDSDGALGDILARLQQIHLTACLLARPDPGALASRLFEWELHDDWDVFSGAVESYAEVLGKDGIAAYRALAEPIWSRIRPRTVGTGPEGGRYRITSIMESLARVSGNVDELIAVKSRDLSLAFHHLEVAQICAAAGRHDEALEWAERGARAFPDRTDDRLRSFLADEYHRRGRPDEAMGQIWANFVDAPSLATYQALQTNAQRVGTWSDWRARALDHLRRTAIKARGQRSDQPPHRWDRPADGSVLVEILRWETDLESAWKAAHELGCRRELWLALAIAREPDHAADSIPIYEREVEALIELKHNEGYRRAVELIARIGAARTRLGEGSGFTTYIRDLRARHGRKRNLMGLLDRAKLGPSSVVR